LAGGPIRFKIDNEQISARIQPQYLLELVIGHCLRACEANTCDAISKEMNKRSRYLEDISHAHAMQRVRKTARFAHARSAIVRTGMVVNTIFHAGRPLAAVAAAQRKRVTIVSF